MMDSDKEAHTTTDNSVEGDIYRADGSSGSLEEEEKIDEDVIIEDRPAETRPGSSGSGQLKTPEDEHDGINDTSDVHEENNSAHGHDENTSDASDMHVHGQEATLPQKGIVEAATNENTNAAFEDDSVVFDDGDDHRRVAGSNVAERSIVEPGATFIPGPGYTGTGIQTGYVSDPDDDNINEGAVILQGFLPEDDPSRRRNSRAESAEERVQRLIDNAITLEDSAVRPIPIEEDGDEENNGVGAAQISSSGRDDDEAVKSESPCWLVTLLWLLIAGGITLAIALPLSMRGKSENEAQDTTGSLSDANCLPGEVDVRLELAKSIVSSITSPDLLEDESTPQGKAIRWIVCDDSISVQLLEGQDPATGNLPKQKHGFRLGGDAGEAQVTRRYILATLSYSTSQSSPWNDFLNFLSPDLHECNWHRNYTRQNFPFGNFDPVGAFCIIDKGELSSPISFTEEILLNDENYPLRYLELNFRIDNDLNGPLPPEVGYLIDCKAVGLENNLRLTGPLPQTMGNMTSLFSMALILNGPDFGGELPSSLFRLKNLTYITIQFNLGKDWSLPSNAQISDDTQLKQIVLKNNFSGKIPSWIAKLKKLQTLDLTMNNFQGVIPEAIGDLSSVEYLNLLGNNLTGTIPSSLGKLPAIEVLILGNNALQGELPTSIENLRTLQLLDVGSNLLTSTIPSSFANLDSLKYLVLESNKFNGTVDVLESMKNLTVLLIRSNSFGGALPDGLFSGTSDNIVVDIGDNKFTDELPASFGNMSNLVSLIGAKNSFVDSATMNDVCDNTTLLVMDCDACECCEVCCDGEKDAVCDFQLDVFTVLGYHCGSWFTSSCLQGVDYFAGAGVVY